MNKEAKVIISVIVGTIILIGGLAFWMTKSAGGGGGADSLVPNVLAQNLEASPSGYMELGDVAYNGGVVSKSFDIKNNSDKDVILRKITTSCMCTTAKFVVNGKESKFYGMEMNGDLNPLISYMLPAGSSGQVVFDFDPKAHGPEGIGGFQRTVTLFFDSGYKEVNFEGTVVQ